MERAWTYSFSDKDGVRHIETFASALQRMMLDGAPVGWALEFFNNRYAELATGLTEDLENIRWQNNPPDDQTRARYRAWRDLQQQERERYRTDNEARRAQ